MIILIHVLYICSEYLWSFFVNRNEVPVLEEPVLNNTESVNVVDSDKNVTCASIKQSKRFLNCPSCVHPISENEVTEENDNLQNDEYGEYEQAMYDYNTKTIRFYPPVYIQRYVKVVNILQDERWKGQIKKVIDIGCSEFGFFKFLRNVDGVEEIIEVDVDKNILKEYSYRVHPWLSDYINERKAPLEVSVLCGNVAHLDHRLEGADAVVAIELIEHLYPSDLEDLPFNIFGVIKPRVAIFTTPNEDFNVLFNNFSGFRHDDHKFEWSRNQFQSWAKNICKRFPDYEVKFVGIGPGPIGKEDLGCCSQAAVFVKIHFELSDERSFLKSFSDFVEYDLIEHIEYPFRADTRTDDCVTRDDAISFINSSVRSGDYFNGTTNEIPLANILLRVYKTCDSSEKLRNILEDSNYEIKKNDEDEYVVLVPEQSVSDSEDENDQFLTESLNESEQYVVHDNDNEIVTDDWNDVEKDYINLWSSGNDSELNKPKFDYVVTTDNAPKNIPVDNTLPDDHVSSVQSIRDDINDTSGGDYHKHSNETLIVNSCTISNKNSLLAEKTNECVSLNTKDILVSNSITDKEIKLDKNELKFVNKHLLQVGKCDKNVSHIDQCLKFDKYKLNVVHKDFLMFDKKSTSNISKDSLNWDTSNSCVMSKDSLEFDKNVSSNVKSKDFLKSFDGNASNVIHKDSLSFDQKSNPKVDKNYCKYNECGSNINKENSLSHIEDTDSSISFPLHNSKNFISYNECLSFDNSGKKLINNIIDEENVDFTEIEMSNTCLTLECDKSFNNEINELPSNNDKENFMVPVSEKCKNDSFIALSKGNFGFITIPCEKKCKLTDIHNENKEIISESVVEKDLSVILCSNNSSVSQQQSSNITSKSSILPQDSFVISSGDNLTILSQESYVVSSSDNSSILLQESFVVSSGKDSRILPQESYIVSRGNNSSVLPQESYVVSRGNNSSVLPQESYVISSDNNSLILPQESCVTSSGNNSPQDSFVMSVISMDNIDKNVGEKLIQLDDKSKDNIGCNKILVSTESDNFEKQVESVLTVSSAYDLDECIESVQAKIKSSSNNHKFKYFSDDKNNFHDEKSSCSKLYVNNDPKRVSNIEKCIKNDELCDETQSEMETIVEGVTSVDKLKSDLMLKNKNDNDKGDTNISTTNCSIKSSDKSIGVLKKISGKCNLKECETLNKKSLLDFNLSVDKPHPRFERIKHTLNHSINVGSEAKCDLSNISMKCEEHNESSMKCNNDANSCKCPYFSSYSCSCISLQSGKSLHSCKKSTQSSFQSSSDRENSFIYSDSSVTDNLELDRKFSETCVHDVYHQVYAYYCTACSSSLHYESNSTSDVSCHHCRLIDSEQSTSASLSGSSNIIKDAECSEPITSSTFLYSDQSNELIIKTHQYESDKSSITINENKCKRIPSSLSINSVNKDQIINESLKLFVDSPEKMTKSHSVGHVSSLHLDMDDYGKLVKDDLHSTLEDMPSAVNYRHELVKEASVEKLVKNFELLMNDYLHTDAERQDSCSPDKAGDSGYPNSSSGRDMEMDLTPEQVQEIMTESESSFENSPPISPIVGAVAAILPPLHPPVLHLGDNVENGDVANNNRDGEGNNMIGQGAFVGEPLEYQAVIDHPQEIPLMAHADLNSHNDENDEMFHALKRTKNTEFTKLSRKKSSINFYDTTESDDISGVSEIHGKFRKSKTLMFDGFSSYRSVDSSGLGHDKSVTDISTSCPESALILTEDETDCSTSYNNVKEWEGYRMVQSYEIKDLKKYESWLADRASQNSYDSSHPMFISTASQNSYDPSQPISTASQNSYDPSQPTLISTTETSSLFPSDSLPCCSTSLSCDTTDHSLMISHSIPYQLYSDESNPQLINNRLKNSQATEDISVPLSFFDEALDSLIREIVEDLFIPESEPFADWLVQIQIESMVENNEFRHNQEHMADVPPVDEFNLLNDLEDDNVESEHEYIVQPDVKGGGDNSASEP